MSLSHERITARLLSLAAQKKVHTEAMEHLQAEYQRHQQELGSVELLYRYTCDLMQESVQNEPPPNASGRAVEASQEPCSEPQCSAELNGALVPDEHPADPDSEDKF